MSLSRCAFACDVFRKQVMTQTSRGAALLWPQLESQYKAASDSRVAPANKQRCRRSQSGCCFIQPNRRRGEGQDKAADLRAEGCATRAAAPRLGGRRSLIGAPRSRSAPRYAALSRANHLLLTRSGALVSAGAAICISLFRRKKKLTTCFLK